MLSPSRAPSSERECVLIAAPSGRALAQAARAAGYLPLVCDFFDDLDTRELAAANLLVEGDFAHGFETAPLMAALKALAEGAQVEGKQVIGLVYGAGFEDRTGLLEEIAKHWPLLGNAPSIVQRVKDPAALAELCADLRVPHPDISFETPTDGSRWLIKHAGGSGGVHIAAAEPGLLANGGYYQRRVAGRPVSSLLLADGTKSLMLGLSEQWATPAPGQPWRFGGAARPVSLDATLAEALTRASCDIAAAAELVGLNSIDFLVEGPDFHLIEINPRPGATLDIFRDHDGRLLRAHIEACRGDLPDKSLRFEAAEAASFVYAPYEIASTPACDWPIWAADRQKPGSAVAEHDPLCTVTASGPDLHFVRRLLDERAAQILTLLSINQREAAA